MTATCDEPDPRAPSLLESAFITLVEPDVGHEDEYDRWYMEDHFYVGAMALPHWFAGKRWVATPDRNRYLGTYWILEGGFEEQLHALRRTVTDLLAQSRMFSHRRHVHTLYYDRVAAVRARPTGPLDLQALDAEYVGLVMELVDVDTPAARAGLIDAIVDVLPGELRRTGADLAVVMTPRSWPDGVELWFDYGPASETQVLVLWFVDTEVSSVATAIDRERSPLCSVGRTSFVAHFDSHLPGRSA